MNQGQIAWRIFAKARRLNITYKEIAEKSGVHKNTISNFSSGSNSISLDKLNKIADAVDLEVIIREKNNG